MATTQIKDGFNGGSDNQLKVNSDGSINVDVTGGGGGTSNTNLIQVGGVAIALGQNTMSLSLPVTIASNQSAIPISGTIAISNFPATQPVSGSVELVGPTNGPVTTTVVSGKTGLDANIIGGVVSGTFQPSGLTVQGVTTMVAIDNTAWYLAPPSPLLLRNNIEIQNPSTSTADMIWGYDNTKPLTTGFHVPPGASRSIAIRGSIPVYITMASGSATVVVEELQ